MSPAVFSEATQQDERRDGRRAFDAGSIDPQLTLGVYQFGRRDRTTRLHGDTRHGSFVRATHTPDGPGTVCVTWGGVRSSSPPVAPDASAEFVVGGRGFSAAGFGPGARWLVAQAPAQLGADDPGAPELTAALDPLIAEAAYDLRGVRIGASGTLYHELLPVILGQRITAGEAVRQWWRLCDTLGDVAPGPFADLRLPPHPNVLAKQPTWWFHPHGVEVKRARPMIEVAVHADKLWDCAAAGREACWHTLSQLTGVGAWTIGSTLGPAIGDPDAFAVGDYHLKNVVAYNLAGEPRATDARMVELLAPYMGQRGRVARLIMLAGDGAPKYGARQRVLPMYRW